MTAAESDHSSADCIAVAVLSHGSHSGQASGQVYGVDGELVDVGQLLDPLKRCPSLLGKPKIVIVEVCLSVCLSVRLSVCLSGRHWMTSVLT